MAVSFEEQVAVPQATASQALSGMSGWLVRKKLAANQTSADLTLLVLAGLIIVISFFTYKLANTVKFPSPDKAVIMRALVPPSQNQLSQ